MALQEITDKKEKKRRMTKRSALRLDRNLKRKESAKRIAEIEKRKAKLEQLANTSIADALEQAGVKKADKQWEKDQKKAEKLIEKRGRKWGPQAANKKAKKKKEAAFLEAG